MRSIIYSLMASMLLIGSAPAQSTKKAGKATNNKQAVWAVQSTGTTVTGGGTDGHLSKWDLR